MFKQLKKVSNIFNKICNTNYINKKNPIKIRNSNLFVKDVVLYRMNYSKKETT